jgi:hypothetical protein
LVPTSRPNDENHSAKPGNIGEPWLYGKHYLVKEYGHLLAAFPSFFKNDPDKPKVVLAIDEASFLKGCGQKFSPSDVVCRVINAYSCHQKASNWVIFSSTDSKIADFSASAKLCAR